MSSLFCPLPFVSRQNATKPDDTQSIVLIGSLYPALRYTLITTCALGACAEDALLPNCIQFNYCTQIVALVSRTVFNKNLLCSRFYVLRLKILLHYAFTYCSDSTLLELLLHSAWTLIQLSLRRYKNLVKERKVSCHLVDRLQNYNSVILLTLLSEKLPMCHGAQSRTGNTIPKTTRTDYVVNSEWRSIESKPE
jgi:hypothetical protein